MPTLAQLRHRLLCSCVARSGTSPVGRIFSWSAAQLTGGYKNKAWIAKLSPTGYVSHIACVAHSDLRLGKRVYIGDRVTMYNTPTGQFIQLDDDVRLYADIVMETLEGGSITLGEGTHVQPRCQFVSGMTPIVIGKRCEIAPACAFYSFDHAFDSDMPVRNQGLRSRGPVVIHDDVWLGYGAVVLTGVTIGSGAVIGANAVVTRDVPPLAVAVGNPARIVRYRKPSATEDGTPDAP